MAEHLLFYSLPDVEPVRRDLNLRLREIEAAGAHFRVQIIFHRIFFVSARPREVRLRPQIFRIVRATEFERDQVINFAAFVFDLSGAVEPVGARFHRRGGIPELFGGSAVANVLEGGAGARRPWGGYRIRKHRRIRSAGYRLIRSGLSGRDRRQR